MNIGHKAMMALRYAAWGAGFVGPLSKYRESQSQVAINRTSDIYGRPLERGKKFTYPSPIKGIPVYSADSIFNQHKELVKQIHDISGVGAHLESDDGTSIRTELFDKVIKRYIEYAHMLPASENHHHSGAGGLVLHSLQASYYSMKISREKRPEKSEWLNIDRDMQRPYRYAAWLGGLLHDAGKMLTDIEVRALDLYVDKKHNRRVKKSDNVPRWIPHRSTLIEWAEQYGVATYTVAFNPERIHNAHNNESVYFLPPIVEKGVVMDYLIDQPINMYERISTALSDMSKGKDYLPYCIRNGDVYSVQKDMQREYTELGDRKLSLEASIIRIIRIARADWTFNEINGHCWVVGGDVYLRYTKAFESMVNVGLQYHFPIPNDARQIIARMEDGGMVETGGGANKVINFAVGDYSESDIASIFKNELSPPVEPMIKVRWKGLIFEGDVIPDSRAGLLIDADGETIIRFSESGKRTIFKANDFTEDSSQHTTPPANSQEANGSEVAPPPPTSPAQRNTPSASEINEVVETADATASTKKPNDNQSSGEANGSPTKQKASGDTAEATKPPAPTSREITPKPKAEGVAKKRKSSPIKFTNEDKGSNGSSTPTECNEKPIKISKAMQSLIDRFFKDVEVVRHPEDKDGRYVYTDDVMKHFALNSIQEFKDTLLPLNIFETQKGRPIIKQVKLSSTLKSVVKTVPVDLAPKKTTGRRKKSSQKAPNVSECHEENQQPPIDTPASADETNQEINVESVEPSQQLELYIEDDKSLFNVTDVMREKYKNAPPLSLGAILVTADISELIIKSDGEVIHVDFKSLRKNIEMILGQKCLISVLFKILAMYQQAVDLTPEVYALKITDIDNINFEACARKPNEKA